MVGRDAIIAIYIMASRRNGTIYTGVTSDLIGRVWRHKTGELGGFSDQYGCRTLVWYEQTDSMIGAIEREKAIKTWRRSWKLALIEKGNPQWKDLAADWYG